MGIEKKWLMLFFYNMTVSVIGAGLSGCEAAYTIANNGINVDLYECKPITMSKAHSYNGFAELVCSNSLKAMRLVSASGLLKAEMRKLGSLILQAADKTAVPAGDALAVNRTLFSDYITEKINAHPLINVIAKEVETLPSGYCIVATGPLTLDALAINLQDVLCCNKLYFYDAAAPIVEALSIDYNSAFSASRYARGTDDYINCPMNKIEYEEFYKELVNAQSVELKEFEFKVYEGCMPVEVMAKRGADTMRFGPLKPVGLVDPNTGHRPWAVVQLRKENAEGSLYNMVGFQTNLKFSEQKRVFSLIPALKNAEFARYGVMHRNTFIDSPRLLDNTLKLKSNPNVYFAGQITGIEGYIESAASGILVGKNVVNAINGKEPLVLPRETMLGALVHYVSDETVVNFQPMGSNMGILPPLKDVIRDKKLRYEALSTRALQALDRLI